MISEIERQNLIDQFVAMLDKAINRAKKNLILEEGSLTTREAATVLGVSVATIHNWVRSGKLKATNGPGGWRFDRAWIEELRKGYGNEQV